MKNAKKILLLVLSLVMLCGVFAVAAFAEEEAVATVVYPDGKEVAVAVGATIEPEAFVTEGEAKVYYDLDKKQLFKDDETEGWLFTVEGEEAPLTDLTVTEAMAGKRIIASGVQRVYYTKTISGVIYYSTEDNLGTYLTDMTYNVVIKMYADHTTKQTTISGKKTMDLVLDEDGNPVLDSRGKTMYMAMNARYDLDLNGHNLTVNSSSKVTCLASAFYVYSTQPGAEYHVEGNSTMFYTNNDDYKVIDGVVYGNTTTQYKNATSMGANKPTGLIVLGEKSDPGSSKKGPYGENLTVYGQSLTGSLYGNTLRIFGGTFVQTGKQAVFSNFTNRNVTFYHATFVLTNPTTVFMRQNTSNRTYDGCTFVYVGEGTIPLFGSTAYTNSGSTDADKHTVFSAQTFNNCNFYNVIPDVLVQYEYTYNYQVKENNKTVTKNTYKGTDVFRGVYSKCYFGFSDMLSHEDMDETATNAYLIYTADGKTVTAAGKTYALNAQINTAELSTYKTVTWPDNTMNYYVADTAEKAEALVKSLPIYPTFFQSYDIEGENNTLFYVEESTIVVTVGEDLCITVTDETVPVQVYYTVETEDGKTYNLNKDTYQADLRKILNNISVKQKVTLYADVTFAATYVYGGTSKPLQLDLNGHTWKITSNYSDCGLDVSGSIYIYSSVPGAEILVPDASAFFRTNDKTVSGVQYTGYMYVGEPDATSTVNGKNLTVYCKRINMDMYQSMAYIYGGNFVQYENSPYSYLFMLSRVADPDGHFQVIRNATFVVTKEGSSPLYWLQSNTNGRTFTNCTFINTTDAYNPLFAKLPTLNNETIGTPSFDNCSFYNIVPQSNYQYTRKDGKIGTVTPVYKDNCRFGFSAFVPTQAMQTAEADAVYIIRGKDVSQIEVLGVTYTLNSYLSATPGVAVTWENLADEVVLEYYEADAVPAAPAHITEWYDYNRGCRWATVASFTQTPTTDAEGNVIAITCTAVWETQEIWAFIYKAGTEMHYMLLSELEDTDEAVGAKFYELFDQIKKTYVVTLYHDIVLTKGLGLGELGVVNDNKVPHYNSLNHGSFTLDLNGYTVRVAEGFVGIDGSNSNTYGANASGVFCIEVATTNTFKICSSRPGARFENASSSAILCIGEGGGCKVEFDAENITFDSVGLIISCFEVSSNYIEKFEIKGGTYIYRGSRVAFNLLASPTIENAEIILTNEKPIAVFAAHRYNRNSSITVKNTKIHSLYTTKLYAIINNYMEASSPQTASITYELALENCTVSGLALENAYSYLDTLTYTGEIVAASIASLQNAYVDRIPADHVAAYKTETIGGYNVTVVGYVLPETASLVNWGFGITEYWMPGSTATHANTVVDGLFGYSFAPLTVAVGENNAIATLVTYRPNTIQMNLTLQSKIGLNVLFAPVLSGATVRIGDQAVTLTEYAEGKNYYVVETAIAPNQANETVYLTIVFNGHDHVIPVSIGAYAKALLADAKYETAHNLTYSMVEYVRAMTGDATFLAGVAAPAGYETQTLTAAPSGNTAGLLESIAFQLDDTIAIALQGTSEANGMEVTLKLATGHVETATVENKKAIFEGLYVNEFYGEMTITIGGETYTYSLANYLNGLTNADAKAGVQALYNYAYYAEEYVTALQNAQ